MHTHITMIRRAYAISASSNGRRQRMVSISADNHMRRCIKSPGSHLDSHMMLSQHQSRMYSAAVFTSSINSGIGCNSGHSCCVAMRSPPSLAAVGHHYQSPPLRSPLYNNKLQVQPRSFFHTSTPVWNKKKKKKRGGGEKKKGEERKLNGMRRNLNADLESLIGIPYGSFNFEQDFMNSSSSTPPRHTHKRGRRRNKRHSNIKQHQSTYQHETHSKSGRLIMTNEKLQSLLDNEQPIITKYVSDNAKNLIHSAQSKMLYTHKYEHEALGPNNDRLFYATLHTEFSDTSCFPSHVILPSQSTSIQEDNGKENTLQLVNIGAARSKKRAETLAATDFILNLQELGINIQSPPDLAAIKRLQKDEIIKSKILKSQMILEVLNVSRPIITTSECYQGRGGGYTSNIEFYCRGTPISITGSVGKSKSEAEGNAMIELTQQDSIFYNFIGTKKMNDILTQIDKSPGGHVAALQIKPLPEEALDVLNSAGLGNDTKHWDRMEEHDMLKKRYEEEFHARQQMKSQNERGSRFSSFLDKRGNNGAEVNEIYIKEEESRLEKAVDDPVGKQGQMKSVRDALPIKAIREDLIDALKTQQVVVVSGGTGSVSCLCLLYTAAYPNANVLTLCHHIIIHNTGQINTMSTIHIRRCH